MQSPATSTPPQPPHERRVPGDMAMWAFILIELTVFGFFFGAYAWSRAKQPEVFVQGQAQLDIGLALINTVLLILGSAAAAWAVWLARRPQAQAGQVRVALMTALAFGAGFLVLKMADFVMKLNAGFDMATDDYWMFYFSLTFFHYLHVILGMVFIGMVWVRLRSVASCGDEQAYWVETVASYWHMVDLVWLVLFALVYIAH
ncbi:cytochrome c oxidase subunit 3 [Brachymonas denitrificans]|uniref:Nitric oxide reductase NorE protein n=1 Tax=Brachymonas denitrificans DSM 15123 TaxID=1121117 RepID=A0A1H8I2P0_9BURK|nr:cytochrome c oxidase subunit 3 [Brachymonas denitrificans]SEN62729.1 nitric oxide reductase NorE protein [Brachymonas denitrificans DSM 15123]